MDRAALLTHLTALDRRLRRPAVLYVYGSGACILLGEPGRTTLDLDVAAPYSRVDFADLEQAARAAGFPVNPPEDYPGDHLEWVTAVRLSLPRPRPGSETALWQGRKLSVKTVALCQLVASKLVRYDATDRSDVQYLCSQGRIPFEDVAAAVAELPAPFAQDPVTHDNLGNLRTDMALWQEG
jgi:hypothetical protein